MRYVLTALLVAVLLSGQSPDRYDIIIEGGRLLDGTGTPWYRADIGIRGDTIAAIGKLGNAEAKQRIQVNGRIVSPGFIDVHSHAGGNLDANPVLESHIRQGVTAVMEGPDGSGPCPVGPALDRIKTIHPSINFGYYSGHNTIRTKVIGLVNRQATPEELDRMKAMVRQDMIEGAFGLATGLFYVPGNYASTDEVIALARVVAPFGGIHISHIRDEAAKIADSVKETIRIGEEGGLPTQVSHHKIIGKSNWGASTETLRLIADARQRGVDVTIDQYPYTATNTGTAAMFPQWSLEGGAKALGERLNAPEARSRIKAEIVHRLQEDRGAGDPKNVQFARCQFDPSLNGKTLADATRQHGLEPTIANAAETAIDIQLKGGCSAIYHAINEDDLVRIMQSPWTMIGSDGEAPIFGQAWPHPRAYGTFPRVLGRYVREKHVLTLEDAVRRMTSFPASRLKLLDRGILRPGMKADIVAFDPDRIIDRSEYASPHHYSEGVSLMIVNGTVVMTDSKLTGQRGGRPLYGPGKR